MFNNSDKTDKVTGSFKNFFSTLHRYESNVKNRVG
jgi:hypothetical protein